MSGVLGDYQRPVVSNRTVLQKEPTRFRWWMIYPVLLICVVAAVWMRRTAPVGSTALVAADVGDNQTKLRERGAAMLVAAQKAKETAASLSVAQRLEPEMMARRQAGVLDTESNTAATAQRQTESGTIASPPEPQPSTPAPVASPPEPQRSSSEGEMILRQPENQAPG